MQAAGMTQEPNEDPESYLTGWGLMQVTSGLAQLWADNNVDTIPYSIDALRDCAATLTPYYTGKLGTWPPGQPATIAELREKIQQITSHSEPSLSIKKE